MGEQVGVPSIHPHAYPRVVKPCRLVPQDSQNLVASTATLTTQRQASSSIRRQSRPDPVPRAHTNEMLPPCFGQSITSPPLLRASPGYVCRRTSRQLHVHAAL
jgi:hypothetical protein